MSNDSKTDTPDYNSTNREIMDKNPIPEISQEPEIIELPKNIHQEETHGSKGEIIDSTKCSIDN